MTERNLNFGKYVDRNKTNCIKFDSADERHKPSGLLSYWVADMDFRVSSYIEDAISEVAARGIFGYSTPDERYFAAVERWMRTRHRFEVSEDWLVKTPGIVFALAQAVRAFTNPGDAVIVQQPVYYPFSDVTRENDRRLVVSELICGPDGRYEIDFDDFEAKIKENDVKLFILCSPHNPVGRVWTRDELTRLGEICAKNRVIVVSDEIHNDFVFQGEHTVFETIAPEFADFTVTCTSPSKTFNIAGLQASNVFIQNEELRGKFFAACQASGYCELNPFGIAAVVAAYEHGDVWRDAMMKYVEENMAFVVDYLAREIPCARTRMNEGTYLMWLDFRASGLSDDEIESKMLYEAKLWLDGGSMFGKSGRCFQRLNVACSRWYLERGLARMKNAFGML